MKLLRIKPIDYEIKRIESACLALVLLGALALRFAGLRWGLPSQSHLFSYHPDEAPLLGAVWRMLVSGDWDPHFYNYGTFYVYLVAVCAKAGAVFGLLPIPRAGWAELHLLARALTALMGTATVYFTYLVGKRLDRPAFGLGAAALLAVLPAHVVNSHYATVDVPAAFMIMLLFVILTRLFERAELAWYVLAGLVLGLAVATKYTMIIALIPFVVAHVFAYDEQGYAPSWLYPIVGIIVAGVAFMAVTPYLLLLGKGGFHFNPEFVRDVSFEIEHMRAGGTFAFVNTGSGWVYHLLRSLPAGMGYVACFFGLLGLALLTVAGLAVTGAERWASGVFALELVSFALPYFGAIGAGKEHFLRYTLPLLPVLALAAAYSLGTVHDVIAGSLVAVSLGDQWKLMRLPAFLGLVILVPTAWYCWQMVGIMMAPDVRDRAANWLRPQVTREIRVGSRLELRRVRRRLVEERVPIYRKTRVGLASDPWFFTPPITPFNGGLRSLEQFRTWQQENPPYDVTVVGWDTAALRRSRPDYFVVSDAEYAEPLRLRRADAVDLMAALPKRYARLQSFEPPPPLPPLRPQKLACPPDWLYTWPRIEVYY